MDLHLDGITNVTANQIAPRRDDKPTKWTEKITRSTDVPGWPIQPDLFQYLYVTIQSLVVII